jgi:tetratricopeptide (TPR) repeat protein
MDPSEAIAHADGHDQASALPAEAAQLCDLAAELIQQKQYGQAIPHCEEALAIVERELGSESFDVARLLSYLAMLYRTTGRTQEAADLCERALVLQEKHLGADHPEVANSLNNLALLYSKMRMHERALPLHERALAIREKHFGILHAKVGQSLNNLVAVYGNLGMYKPAEPLCKRSLEIKEHAFGPDHPQVRASSADGCHGDASYTQTRLSGTFRTGGHDAEQSWSHL